MSCAKSQRSPRVVVIVLRYGVPDAPVVRIPKQLVGFLPLDMTPYLVALNVRHRHVHDETVHQLFALLAQQPVALPGGCGASRFLPHPVPGRLVGPHDRRLPFLHVNLVRHLQTPTTLRSATAPAELSGSRSLARVAGEHVVSTPPRSHARFSYRYFYSVDRENGSSDDGA